MVEIQANASHSGEGYKDYLLNLKKCQVRKKYDKLSEEVPDVHMKHMASNPLICCPSIITLS